jgi:arylsulfatase A-like enzyme
MTMDWSATMLDAADVAADARFPLDGISLGPVLDDPARCFARPLHWRMNHRGQRALREGRWKYLRVDGHDYLFDLEADERERANRAPREPTRLARMRSEWEAWNATMPPIPADATVSLGYGAKDMPQR